MKRFKFKLEAILAERKRAEDLKLKEWTIARRFLQALMDDLASLEKGMTDAINKGDQLAASDRIDNVGMFSAVDSFIQGQKLRIVWKGREIERGAKITERKRQEYVATRQKREVLEKFKERKRAEHRAAVQKQELKMLDDIYIMNGAARRRMDEEEAGL